MVRRKRKETQNDSNRFEQISLFELYVWDDEPDAGTQATEGIQQPTLFDFETEGDTGYSGGTTTRTDQRTFLPSVEGSIEGTTIDGDGLVGNGTAETESNQSSTRDHYGMGESVESVETEVHGRVSITERTLSTDNKISYNIQAIQTLKNIQKEQRKATENEKVTMSLFSGWGGCPALFNESDTKYLTQRNQLKDLLSIQEYQDAKSSVLTSFYTPLQVIEQIYKVLEHLGFEDGKILETSMGTGNFIGMMPEDMYSNSEISGVEIEGISSSISKLLYDKAYVQNNGYEVNTLPKNYFDLAISNVPFGNFKISDMEFNSHHWNIHNYFFGKALSQVRNGGLIAFVTSTDTMDGNSDIMEYINSKADFLGAIRLPNDIFMLNGANTHVTSDIIFLRRNDEKIVELDHEITHRSYVTEHRRMNDYFINHPEMVLGTIGEKKNQYGTYELTVQNNGKDLESAFEELIPYFDKEVYSKEDINEQSDLLVPMDTQHSERTMNAFFVENDTLYYRSDNYYYPVHTKDEIAGKDVPSDYVVMKNKKDLVKAKCLIAMAEVSLDVVRMQIEGADEFKYLMRRDELNALYDDFYRQYGAIHKKGNLNIIESDPNQSLIESLEIYDPKTGESSKADIFKERTIRKREQVKYAENLQDAIRLSLNEFGKLDIPYISSLYSKNEEEVIEELLASGMAFKEPITKQIVLAEEYLSGNIFEKIEIAENHHYMSNVDALRNVLPERIEAEEIKIQLGATWVPNEYYEEFINELFDEPIYAKSSITYDSITAQFYLNKPNKWSRRGASTETWGVPKSENVEYPKRQPDYTGYELFDDVLNSKIPTLRNYWDEKNSQGNNTVKSELNAERTQYARDLANQLQEEFEEWIWNDYERKNVLVDKYNRLFNSVRLREYDGSFLTFPEMNQTMALEPYQKNAVARIMDTNTNTLLWQNVGSGKTFEMVSAGMEMRRLGIRNKILYIVPNHLVSQWHKEFLQLYPNAKVLAETKKDMSKDKRKVFVNKIATGNYDAIIMAHSSFKLLSVGNEKQIEFLNENIREVQTAIDQMRWSYDKNSTRIVKQLERTKKSIESNIKKLTETPRDDNLIPFESLGIDYLFVDEAHEFKNLYTYTSMQNVAGIQTQHSQKASDLYMKCKILESGGGGICFATGTPVTNTMAELYNMQRYLQEEELNKQGIHCFDAWAKAYGSVTNSFEISVDGSRFVNRTRFCKFYNVSELMTQFKMTAEIQTAGMLRKALEESTLGRKRAIPPKHVGGKPTVVQIEPSEELENYIADIVERTEAIHDGGVDPTKDNMLKVTSDSKKASIDMRMIDPSYPDREDSKLWQVAKKVQQVYQDFDEQKATQLVFCDSSTPSQKRTDEWFVDCVKDESYQFDNVYEDLKRKMIMLGIQANEIAFIHDYKSETEKLNLYQRMNKGEIRVLFGSTQKLGAGTNVQNRLKAIHHVDVPWRSSDVEQQNGRGFRQGNMFDEIYEFRYVTKKSFDAYSWQMVETKSSYMEQLLNGSADKREIEEDNSNSFSYAEVKAIASGNPIIKEKFEVDNEVKRLETLYKQYKKKKMKAQDNLVLIPKRLENTTNTLRLLEREVEHFRDVDVAHSLDEGKFLFRASNGVQYTNMKGAWEWVEKQYKDIPIKDFKEMYVGTFNKGKVYISMGMNGEGYIFRFETPARFIRGDGLNTVGRVNFSRMNKCITDIRDSYVRVQNDIDKLNDDYRTATELVEQGFSYDEELRTMRNRQKEINTILSAESTAPIVEEETQYEEDEEQGYCI